MKLTPHAIRLFQKTILTHYAESGRDLPWRKTDNPWQILVSEMMLQQTQASRVVPFFKRFVKQFPTPSACASASLKEVLTAWQGLGYNRRALALKGSAEILVRDFGGRVPNNAEKLDALPGIGPYTAGAIQAFAFNEPAVFIETNIRSVFLHFFFPRRRKVSDEEILKLVEQTLPMKVQPFSRSKVEPFKISEWYSALMDYGAMLKVTVGNPNTKSTEYAKQSRFKGSRRELRGQMLRQALRGPIKEGSAPEIISDLVAEGFLQKQGRGFILAS